MSEKREDDSRYILKKDIKYTRLGEALGLSRQTVSTRFKNLIQLGLIEEKTDTYELVKLDNNVAWLIQQELLQLMIDTLSQNTVSTYVYLFNRFYANENKPFQFTIEQIKNHIGISTTTRSNDEIVSNILFILQKLGIIKYSLTTLKQEGDNFNNVKTIHQLDWITNDIVKIKC